MDSVSPARNFVAKQPMKFSGMRCAMCQADLQREKMLEANTRFRPNARSALCGCTRRATWTKSCVKMLVGATLIDLAWIAQASLAGMAAISVQDDADMARHRPLLELMKESALVNPIKETQEE